MNDVIAAAAPLYRGKYLIVGLVGFAVLAVGLQLVIYPSPMIMENVEKVFTDNFDLASRPLAAENSNEEDLKGLRIDFADSFCSIKTGLNHDGFISFIEQTATT